MADWSSLPAELLRLIARRLHFVEDYVRFGGVCWSWRLITLEKDCYSCSILPWLMFTEMENNDMRRLYSPFSNKVYELNLPEIRGRRCWGSSYGWLVTVGTDLEMRLLNPLSHVQISLPPLHKCPNLNKLICTPEEFRNFFVYKVLLSSSPSSLNCVVMAIYSNNRKIAFAKPGDNVWTPLKCPPGDIFDAIFFNGNFYAVVDFGDVLVCDLTGSHVKTITFTQSQIEDELDFSDSYLVELGGDIHVIVRCMYDTRITDTPYLRTSSFIVYKVDVCTEKWQEVSSLGDWSIFLGSNHSFPIWVSDFPECRKNCIYFTDDYSGLYYDVPSSYDMGIYNLEDSRIEPYLEENVSHFMFSLPLWIRPSLW